MNNKLADDDDDVPQLLDIGTADAYAGGVVDVQSEAEPKFDAAGRRLNRHNVPLTLLTGYFGAGKSTLLEYILTAEHGYRIAVCMNDFGDTTDIEAKSLQMSNPTDPNAPSTNLLTLPNGCLCCSVKDMGIAAIEEMVAAQRERIDWVMVELTGLADPAPIAKDFWANEEMGDLILDSVICVVDSRNVLKQLAEERSDGTPNEAQKQVACADVILLNKADLVTAPDLDAVAAAVSGINPTLRVHRTVRGNVALGELFDLRAFTSPAVASLAQDTAACGCTSSDHDHDHEHTHGSGDETPHAAGSSAIATATLRLPTLSLAQFDRLNAFLESLLWQRAWPASANGSTGANADADTEMPVPDVLRTKGYALLEDGSARIIQGVADLFEIRELSSDAEQSKEDGVSGSSPVPKLVFIGRGVDHRLAERVGRFIGV